MIDTFKAMDFAKIAELQDSFLDEWGRWTIPLKHIPELTYDIWMNAVDCDALSDTTKNLPPNCEDSELLSDWYCEMLECSWIGTSETTKRWKWFIMFDDINQIYWKLEHDLHSTNCVIMEHWVNYLLND